MLSESMKQTNNRNPIKQNKMKKLVIVIAMLTVGMVSCKKEESATPSVKAEKAVMGGATKNMGGWD